MNPQMIVKNKFMETVQKAVPEKQKVIVIHINHPREITPELKKLVKIFYKNGFMVMSQTVLLKGVNDSEMILANLFKSLFEIGIKPYYLHHLDIARGTHYFRVSIEKGKKILRKLRKKISSACLPKYVIDFPQATGKIQVFSLKKTGSKTYKANTLRGKKINYIDFA